MPEPYKHLEKVLRECAQSVVSDTTDPWPTIRERVSGERTSGTRVSEEHTGEAHSPGESRSHQLPRLVPNTLLGWALAVCSVLILGVGVYAASGPVRELIGYGLPGPGAPGETTRLEKNDGRTGDTDAYTYYYPDMVPGGGGEEINQVRTAGGAKVTLGFAYADTRSVVVGFDVEDLQGGRRVEGYPAELHPVVVMDQPGKEKRADEEYSERVRLTDQGGSEFKMVDAGGVISMAPDNVAKGPLANHTGFETDEKIEPGSEHRFRLEIPLLEQAITKPGQKMPPPEPLGESLVFDFEIPVHPAPIVQVNEKDTAGGITLTLDQVTDSPGRPAAVICLEPQDGVRGWFPSGRDLISDSTGPVAGKRNCYEMLLDDPLDGRSSVTVTHVEVNPMCPSCAREEEIIRGPWTFEFEMPER